MNDYPADLLTDWNQSEAPPWPDRPVAVHDETLRDGLQSTSIRQPAIDDRLELLHLMDRLGIESVDLGMPCSHNAAKRTVIRLANEIRNENLRIDPVCAARTVVSDVADVADVAQSTGLAMSVMAFVGISRIRFYVEQWELDAIVREITEVVTFARREGLDVCLVTEDTTRSPIDVALAVYTAGLEAGANRICVCDTVGSALPWGAASVVRSIKDGLAERGFSDVGIDWHGHNDRGVAIANSLAAASAGADRLHGSALGIGERAGNASMEQLLVNLDDIGHAKGDLRLIPEYCTSAARACAVDVPGNQPFIGQDVYRTAAGVHAAAIRKALRLGDSGIAERVYAGIPASRLGREQHIDVGPGSGRANILHWLEQHDIEPAEPVVTALETAVRGATRIYADEELLAIATKSQPVAAKP